MTAVQIISLHVPKCAGISMRNALEQQYEKDRIYYEYDKDSPFNPRHPVNADPDYFKKFSHREAFRFLHGKQVVHGHFHPNKYAVLTPAIRITMLREPVERMISHYYFWQNYPRHNHPLHDYLLDHSLSLESFAELEPVRYFYSGVFFKNVHMRLFNVIGGMDRMDDFLNAFSRITFTSVPLRHANANRFDEYESLKNDILSDTRRMNHLKGLLADDIAFYERWAGYGCD